MNELTAIKELTTLEELIEELMTNPKICSTAKINLGFAKFSVSQATLDQIKEEERALKNLAIAICVEGFKETHD